MAGLTIRWADIEKLKGFEGALRSLASQHDMHNVARLAINRTGDMARTQVVRALIKQTGLKRQVIVKAVKVTRANFDRLNYVMTTRGGEISLKHFGPRETRRGGSAAPFGQRRLYPSSFMRGGTFPDRVVVARFKGHVFQRVGASRLAIEKLKSGVFIPSEMIKGETADVFRRTVAAQLPRRVEHELNRITGGLLC